jgi:Mg2+/Co2+ transporter CorB
MKIRNLLVAIAYGMAIIFGVLWVFKNDPVYEPLITIISLLIATSEQIFGIAEKGVKKMTKINTDNSEIRAKKDVELIAGSEFNLSEVTATNIKLPRNEANEITINSNGSKIISEGNVKIVGGDSYNKGK